MVAPSCGCRDRRLDCAERKHCENAGSLARGRGSQGLRTKAYDQDLGRTWTDGAKAQEPGLFRPIGENMATADMAENARRWSRLGVTATAVVALTAWMAAQAPPAAPAGQDDAQVRAGATLFRERCAECHGADGKGVAGHDLTRLWSAGATDARVFQTIRSGVPNTIMPSSTAPDDQLWALVAYLRSASGTPAVRASASLVAGLEPVTLVTRDGRRIRAVRKSEDAFSVQVMEAGGRLQGYLKSDLLEVIRETVAVEVQERAGRWRHLSGSARGLSQPHGVAVVLGRLQRSAAQPAHPDHGRQRSPAHHALDVSDRDRAAARLRGDATRRRRRDVPDRTVRERLGTRRTHRAAVLALPARAAERPHLRRDFARQPRLRDPWRPPVHGDARRARGVARRQDRSRALGHHDGRLQDRLCGHGRAARDRRQGDRGDFRRRLSHARLPGCVRPGHGCTPVALLHGARCGRTRQRHVAELRVDDTRGRGHVGDRQLRPRPQPARTGARATPTRSITATIAGAAISTPRRSSPSTLPPASCGGITSSRPTTSTIGIPTTCRCWPRCRSAASRDGS